jgi:hypothetical protein
MTILTNEAPIIANEADLSYDLALAAWTNSSHTPEQRARSEQRGYVASVQNTYNELLAICKNDAQRDLLADEMERFRQNYLKHYTAMLSAMSRTASAFIVGPANFPTSRNQKRLDTVDRRREEFLGWLNSAKASIRKKLLAARTPEEQDSVAWQALRADIARSLGYIADADTNGGPFNRSAFVNSIAGKVERLAKNGEVALVDRAVALVDEYNASHKKPAISRRHTFWTYPDVARKAAEAQQAPAADGAVIATGDGWSIETAPEDDRVRIYFDGKPDEATRSKLKGAGWKWAPSAGAWQRKLTNNAIASAKVLMGC